MTRSYPNPANTRLAGRGPGAGAGGAVAAVPVHFSLKFSPSHGILFPGQAIGSLISF
jgi:hypothetical protein